MSKKLSKAFDPSSARRTLQRGIAKGLWTLEDLDEPTEGYLLATGQRWNKEKRCLEWKDERTALGHKSVIPKHQIPPHRNLLRDPEPIEAVEASADPRDFDPGSIPDTSGTSPQILGQEEKQIYSEVDITSDQTERVNEPLPF